MSDRDTHVTMVADCIHRESKLSDWERSFIDSLDNQLAKGRGLTEKQIARLDEIQIARLDEIWEKVT